MAASNPRGAIGVPQLSLIALFVTALLAAQVTASKVVAIDIPVTLPVTGDLITVPAAVFAYAITFFASDCYTELYGFHGLKQRTGGRMLWLRNVVSTATSQLVDTVIFIVVAFAVFQGTSTDQVLSLIVGQYLFKLALVGLDTPFVYLAVGLVRSQTRPAPGESRLT